MQFITILSFFRMKINITTFLKHSMKYISIVFSICLLALPVFSQSVSISVVDEYKNFGLSDYPMKSGKIIVAQNQITLSENQFYNPVAWSLAPGGHKAAILESRGGLTLRQIDHTGRVLSENQLEFFDPSDETLSIYQLDDGRAVIRDNVANFTFLDPRGETTFSESNSSQSQDGERESQFVSDKNGRTIVLFNPVIRYGDQTGSRAKLVYGEQDTDIFFRDMEREIQRISITENGSFISLIVSNNTGSRVLTYDRFGNPLNEFDFDGDVLGAILSENGEYLTVYTSGRVQVFNHFSGEGLGSSSSRTSIIHAEYQPEDETVIMLGGSESNGQITNPSLTAVHLSKRQIVREDIGFSISALSSEDIRIQQTDHSEYRISGLNRPLQIRTNF